MTPMEDFYGYENFGGNDFSAMFAMDFAWSLIWSVFGLLLIQYVLQSVGLYTVAKRRGIRHAWLSWLPIGNNWLLGCISDQYQYVVKGRSKRKRAALLVLSLLVTVLGVWLAARWIRLIREIAMRYQEVLLQAPMDLALDAARLMGLLLALWCVSIAFLVVKLTALYHLYASCVPGDRVVYLLLSIFLDGCTPILIFACRRWDLGMPARKTQLPQEAQNSVEDNPGV